MRHLPVGLALFARADAFAGIGQAQRARGAGQAGGGDTGDLRSHVGAQRHHAVAVGVHEPETLLGRRSAGAGEQVLLEFHQRRFDAGEAMAGEDRHQGFDGAGFGLRVGRQKIAQAGGQQRRVRGEMIVHAARL